LFLGYFQPLTPPQPLNPLVIDLPTGLSQQSRNPAIAIAAILAGKFGHIRHQAILICLAPWDVSLGRSMLAQYPADTTLRYGQMFTDMMDALAVALRA